MENEKKKKPIYKRWTLYIFLILIVGVFAYRSFFGGDDRASLVKEVTMAEIETRTDATTDVALVRSSQKDAKDITEEEVRDMVREAVGLAGGLEDIVSDGDFVVLKPNLIGAKHFAGGRFAMFSEGNDYVEDKILEKTVNGISTDIRIIKAAVELVRELNPSGKVYIMETSGWGDTRKNMELMGWTKENIPGVDEILTFDDAGGDYNNLNMDDFVAVDLGDKKLYTEDMDNITKGLYFIEKTYYSADVVIDLPVLKSHVNAAMTGAIKNVAIGTPPVKIYGQEGTLNRMYISHAWDGLNKFIHDYYMIKPVDFVITDGLQGSENGPMAFGSESYEGALKNMRLILSGRDAVAVDTIHSYIIGMDPQQIDCLTLLAKDNMGIVDPAKINVLGNASVGDVKKVFGVPGFPYSTFFPEPQKRMYSDFEAPQISLESASLEDKSLKGKISSNEDLIKLAFYIDGEFSGSIAKTGQDLEFDFSDENLTATSSIEISGFDKYLNSSKVEVDLQ